MADTSAQDRNLPASQRKLDKARAEGVNVLTEDEWFKLVGNV